MSSSMGLFCEHCGLDKPESQFRIRCKTCGRLLKVRYDLNLMKKALSEKSPWNWSGSILKQWMEILPIDNAGLIDKVSLGEEQTPLVRSSYLGKQMGIEDLRFKLEFTGPTLSLKDRGSSLCALKAIELGYSTLCIASSGNNAASVAAYAAKAGLEAVVFILRVYSPAKVLKIMAYGARMVRINGDISTASKVCDEMAERHKWFPCGGANPYRFTAKRTVAYEIIQQLGGRVPDAVAFPVAGAQGMASAYTGFSEMARMGMIPSLPKMIGVQLEACDPVSQAFEKGSEEIQPVPIKPTISDVLLNNTPPHGLLALKAARETGGLFVSISDEEFIRAVRLLASKEGLFVEPAGAISVAAMGKILEQGRLRNLKTVVCMLTGHGLNAPQAAADPEAIPDAIEPDVSAVEDYLARR
jgi:threonine synthase